MKILHYLKRFSLVTLLLCVITPISAQRQFELINSPDGKSVIYVYLPNAMAATGKAVVCCPGGGYQGLSMQNEGTNWIPYFMDRGIAFIILKYRMPNGDPQLPIQDAQQAIRTVRDSAQAWHINPHDVGLMGFSAGGHLVSTIATHAMLTERPDFQILFYPVITMMNKTHQGSVDHLLGDKKEDEAWRKQYSNELWIHRHITPPALIFTCNNDDMVPPTTNCVAYYSALRKNHVDATMYIFPGGYHGFGFRDTFPYHYEMRQLLDLWLKGIQPPKTDAIRVACIGNSITDGNAVDLSDINAYPGQLQKLLGKDYWVKNYGVSARTMLNSGDHPYMKDFESDMQSMIDELRALKSKPEIYLAFPLKAWQNSFTISDEVIRKEIIPIINRLAKKNNLKTIDLYSALDSSDLLVKDGIHPNTEGAKRMAETVYKAIVGN